MYSNFSFKNSGNQETEQIYSDQIIMTSEKRNSASINTKFRPKSKRKQSRYKEKITYVRPSSTEFIKTQKKLIYEEPAPYVSATHWCIID